jgi:polyferredoxin
VFAVELTLGLLAALMAVFTALVIRWAVEAKAPLQAAGVVFLLVMMAAMFGGAVVYYLHPGTAGLVEGLWLAAGLMSLGAFIPFFTFIRLAGAQLDPEAEPQAAPTLTPLHKGILYAAMIAGLVLANEFLMGWAFTLASGVRFVGLAGGVGAWTTDLAAVIDSPWFLFTMAGEMALTAYLLRAHLDRPLVTVVAFQAALMFLSPPALASSTWRELSVLLGSAAMIVLFVYLLEHIYRHKEITGAYATYLVRILAVYGAMMAGLFLWAAYGEPRLFAAAILLEMFVYLDAVVRPDRFRVSEPMAWQLNARWAFQLLAYIFVAELFMGALLDLQLEPTVFAGAWPALPLSGAPFVVLENAVSNGFWFFALVAGSTWFLAMMGAEMGALVVFKFKEVRQRETKVRLALMIGCYALFATFFPSVYYTALFPHWASGTQVPVLGWSMGLGSAPIVPSLFLVILVTYGATGILSSLFGRRVVCSVFCTAPLMYQGTTIDAMKTFNRSSPIARKYLSSRFSSLYATTTGVVMVALVGTSFLSYFDQIGKLHVLVGGTDPSVFLFALSFSVLWYVMFVTIPYTGNYNCVTMGWCYTGTIAQAFQKIGFFKLKVKDRQVCKNCTTLDCAKSCPVGLVDMPGHFRQKGEFRSTKCCGVGNCVGACPYDNLYIYDIRHWLRGKAWRPASRSTDTILPVLRPTDTRAGLTRASPPGAAPGSTVTQVGSP